MNKLHLCFWKFVEVKWHVYWVWKKVRVLFNKKWVYKIFLFISDCLKITNAKQKKYDSDKSQAAINKVNEGASICSAAKTYSISQERLLRHWVTTEPTKACRSWEKMSVNRWGGGAHHHCFRDLLSSCLDLWNRRNPNDDQNQLGQLGKENCV